VHEHSAGSRELRYVRQHLPSRPDVPRRNLSVRRASVRASSSLALAGFLLAACGSDPAPLRDAGPFVDAGVPVDGGPRVPRTLGPADRRAEFVVPPAHDGTTPLPLMMLLHGYGATGSAQGLYFRASATARARGYYLILPDGTVDSSGNHFWNATPACCNNDGSTVDDVAYLTSLIDEAESLVPVDTTRVYIYGHSNGGFMSYRLACELSERITAIVSLAGADFLNETDCVPTRAVSVLQVHGTLDDMVAYDGTAEYPSARDDVLRWAGRAGCDAATSTSGGSLDLVDSLPGAETTVEKWNTGCEPGLDAELWTITGGSHIPSFNATWPPAVADWLLRHHR
jgi:polyhydroxybutyrate depolymerase